jgi:ribonuclease HII
MAVATTFERRFWERGVTRIAGVDEAGRGCLAGPVVAAACVLPTDCPPLDLVRDSKLLSRERRDVAFELISEHALAIGIGAASRREIDRLNVRVASVLAMERALRRIGAWDHALIDGPQPPELDPALCTGIIDGDDLCLSIACASIVAKVTRDRLMTKLSQRHPEFRWDSNAGYGTPHHKAMLYRLGPTPHHRRSFRPVSQLPLPEIYAMAGND